MLDTKSAPKIDKHRLKCHTGLYTYFILIVQGHGKWYLIFKYLEIIIFPLLLLLNIFTKFYIYNISR